MSSMEQKNSFGSTEGVTPWRRGGPAVGASHWVRRQGLQGAHILRAAGSMRGLCPAGSRMRGAHVLFDCRYPTIRRTFVISKP